MLPEDLAAVNAFWERHCDPEGWNFYVADAGNGDLYRILTLMRPFRGLRAGGRSIRVITGSRPQAALCSMFSDVIDHVVCTPEARFNGRTIRDWRRATGRDHLRPGELINLYPVDYFQPPLDWGRLWYLLNDRGIFFIHLYKFLLGLQLDISPDLPFISDEARVGARALFEQAGLDAGRTLLLFPYAKSAPFSQSRPDVERHFAALAKAAAEQGLRVCTSVAPAEDPIDGTDGVFIPLDLLIPFCDLAGYAVTVRSGISDILSGACCRKLHIYPSEWMAEAVSPIADGVGGVERNLSFVFAEENDPPRFAALALDALQRPVAGDASTYVPRHISDLLAAPLTCGDLNGRFRQQDFVIRNDYARLYSSGALADGWSGSENWGIWTLGYRATLYLRPAAVMLPDIHDRPEQPVNLVLDLTFALSESTRETLDCTIEVNGGERVPHVARWPDRWRVFHFPLPREALDTPTRITVTVRDPKAASNPVGEQRLLGLIGAFYESTEAQQRTGDDLS
jgi:hypothetical protein